VPCTVPRCPVRSARWAVSTREDAPWGERWYPTRLKSEWWWCKTHARDKARLLNKEEYHSNKTLSLKRFLTLIGNLKETS